MTFCIAGLVCWAYVLMGEVKHAGHMLILTVVPVVVITFIWLKAGGEPGKVAKTILGQILVAGFLNAAIMLVLGRYSAYLGIPLYLFLTVCVVCARVSRFMPAPKKKKLSDYERGYRDGAFTQRG